MVRQHLSPFWHPITAVTYARAYVDAAAGRGLSATLTVLPARGHEILNDDAVLDLVVGAL
jgi:hypothetical protein